MTRPDGKIPPSVALPPGTRIGSYEITAQIGVGGMGEVYRARDTRLDRDIAIKVLPESVASDAERLARFEREAKTLAALNHPGIAAIYGLEEGSGTPRPLRALVMELVEGPTLADRIAQGPIPVHEALPIAQQIAEALEAAHEQGIVHRDLKPANIKVRPDGTVKVLDFGLAKAVEPAGSTALSQSMSPTITTPAMTQAGLILGTAAYMSPEQAAGRAIDKRTDVFSFGCVLYECLTGRKAFDAETITETIAAIIHATPDWSALPAATPSHVARLLRRCLEKDRKKRTRDMGDAALELADLPVEPVDPPAASRSYGGWLAGLGLVGLLLVGAYVVSTWPQAPSAVSAPGWEGETLGGPAVAGFPLLSPDETWLAFLGQDRGNPQVSVMRPGAYGDSRQLTDERERGYAFGMAWDLTSSGIYFSRIGPDASAIYYVSLGDVSDERLILEDASDPRPLEDGSILAVETNDAELEQLIRYTPATNLREQLPVLLVSGMLGQSIEVLPGGRAVVVAGRPVDTAEGENHVYVLDLGTMDMTRLAPDLDLTFDDWVFPLSVLGDEAYFDIRSGELHDIVAVKLDGTPGVRTVAANLTSGPRSIDLASDGTLYLDQYDDPSELVRVDHASGDVVDRFPLAAKFGDVLPLGDGRFLLAGAPGQDQVMVMTPPAAPRPFLVNSRDESRAPLARVGDDLVAFLIGPADQQELALVTVDGRPQERIPLDHQGAVTGLASSPDGATLYYALDGTVYIVPAAGGESTEITRGLQLAVDPSTGDLIVLLRGDVGRLVRRAAADGSETPILVTGDWQVNGQGIRQNLQANAVSSQGLLALRALPRSSWFFPTGIIDARRGGAITPLLDDPDTDMFSVGWDREGYVVMLASPYRSSLWRFRPVSQD